MKQEAYDRTLRARAFDLSRYLLPLATNTSLGQIVSARTLEKQVSRLLSHTHAEVRRLASLRAAAREPAYNVNHANSRASGSGNHSGLSGARRTGRRVLLRPVKVAPTLMKYAEPSAYDIDTRRRPDFRGRRNCWDRLRLRLLPGGSVGRRPAGDRTGRRLLYQHSHHSYRQIREVVEGLASPARDVVDLGLRHRGRDDVLRAFIPDSNSVSTS